jgi:hypothetical protein
MKKNPHIQRHIDNATGNILVETAALRDKPLESLTSIIDRDIKAASKHIKVASRHMEVKKKEFKTEWEKIYRPSKTTNPRLP